VRGPRCWDPNLGPAQLSSRDCAPNHRVNPYPGARRQNETQMFSDDDETSPSIAAVSALSVACSMLAVQQQKRLCRQFVDGVGGMTNYWRECESSLRALTACVPASYWSSRNAIYYCQNAVNSCTDDILIKPHYCVTYVHGRSDHCLRWTRMTNYVLITPKSVFNSPLWKPA